MSKYKTHLCASGTTVAHGIIIIIIYIIIYKACTGKRRSSRLSPSDSAALRFERMLYITCRFSLQNIIAIFLRLAYPLNEYTTCVSTVRAIVCRNSSQKRCKAVPDLRRSRLFIETSFVTFSERRPVILLRRVRLAISLE